MLVVSPLVALMIDQVKNLRSRDVKCSIVTSSSGIDKDLLATDSSLCEDSLLFCTPEALMRYLSGGLLLTSLRFPIESLLLLLMKHTVVRQY